MFHSPPANLPFRRLDTKELIWSFLLVSLSNLVAEPIDRIWLTHGCNDAGRVTVNWETSVAGESVVEFGASEALGKTVKSDGAVKLHHVEIELDATAGRQFYRVRSGADVSAVHSFKNYVGKELRVGVIADRGYARDKDLDALLKDDVHLLVSCGDNVASLHEKGKEGTKAFSDLIDSAPKLFSSTPFMPILGNHDRELTPRGGGPPEHAVYDVEAKAFREFFPLPNEGWKWRFDLPRFGVRWLALDASHVKDQGTTWQTCHPVVRDSVQHQWFAQEVERKDAAYVFTLYNEQNSAMRGVDKGAWKSLLQQSSAVITGFGYFGEVSRVDGVPYFNTCLKGDGALYKDPQSEFVAQEDNYLLVTFVKDAPKSTVALKNLRGQVLRMIEISSFQNR